MARQAWVRWGRQIEFNRIENTDETYSYGLYMILEKGFKRSRKSYFRAGKSKEVIYIGIVKSSERSFYQRMNEHRKDWLSDIGDNQVFVKFGIVEAYDNIDDQLIEDVESALVHEHQPSENTSKKRSYSLLKEIVVKNINHEGFVDATIDTRKHV